jgi:N6-adenosine-specific RNA methylase IME4
MTSKSTGLALYDDACRKLAEARSVDEVKHIHDLAVAMAAYARMAKNRDAEADAIEIRMRATRRLGQMIREQEKTVGLNQGAIPGKTGVKSTPVLDPRPTLASQGIDKNLAKEARAFERLDDAAWKRKLRDARASSSRVFRRIIREIEIEQEREARRAQSAQGGSVADLHALIASGYRAGIIAIDPPWPFAGWSERSNRRPTDHYETMTIEEIKALPIKALAAENCAVFCWATWPLMPMWTSILDAWGVTFSGLAFDWVKLNKSGKSLHWGTGLGTRANPEPCLLARIGSPLRLDEGVHSIIMAPVGAHSEKPDEAYRRMERLFGGPRLELFARKPREGWHTWGDELPPPRAPR